MIKVIGTKNEHSKVQDMGPLTLKEIQFFVPLASILTSSTDDKSTSRIARNAQANQITPTCTQYKENRTKRTKTPNKHVISMHSRRERQDLTRQTQRHTQTPQKLQQAKVRQTTAGGNRGTAFIAVLFIRNVRKQTCKFVRLTQVAWTCSVTV